MPNIAETIRRGVENIQTGIGLPDNLTRVSSTLGLIIKVVLASAGVLFILMFLFGGVTYLTGAGNEETTTRAKRMMVDALVGVIITVSAWAITTFILRFFGFARQVGA